MSDRTADKPIQNVGGTQRLNPSSLPRLSRIDYVYFVGLIVYILANIIGYTSFADQAFVDTLIGYARWCAALLLLARLVLHCALDISAVLRDHIFIGITLFLAALSVTAFFCAGEKTVFPVAVLIVSSYKVDFRTISKVALITLSTSVIALILLSIIGVLDFNVIARGTDEAGQRIVRYAFCFSHPNNLGAICVLGFLLYSYLVNGEFNIKSMFVSVMVILILYFIIDSRTAALTILVGVIAVIAFRMLKMSSNLVSNIIACFSILCVILGIGLVLVYRYEPDLIEPVNQLLSDRLYYANEFLDNYSLSLFGQHVDLVGSVDAFNTGMEAHVLDNVYYHLIIHYGVFSLAVFLGLYCLLFVKSKVTGLNSALLATALMAFVGISETWPFSFVGSLVLTALLSTSDNQISKTS